MTLQNIAFLSNAFTVTAKRAQFFFLNKLPKNLMQREKSKSLYQDTGIIAHAIFEAKKVLNNFIFNCLSQ